MRKVGPGHYDVVRAACQALGGRIAHTRLPPDVEAVAAVATGEPAWIGLTYLENMQQWAWDDNHLQPFFWADYWPEGYPRPMREWPPESGPQWHSCVSLRNVSDASGWINHGCNQTLYGVCAARDHCRDAAGRVGEQAWCRNGGVCTSDPANGAVCTCPAGFAGLRCQRIWNEKTVITTPAGPGWVPLLLGAWYHGAGPLDVTFNPLLAPGVTAGITKLRFVHRSGFVSNAQPRADDWSDHPWDHHMGNFAPDPYWTGQPELKINGEWVVEAGNYNVPAPNCPITPQTQNQRDGDFVCDVDISITASDAFTLTFWEASHAGGQHEDNTGTHYIDLWGFGEATGGGGAPPFLDKLRAHDANASAHGTGCATPCDAGFTAVLHGGARCNDDGTWAGPAPRCLGAWP